MQTFPEADFFDAIQAIKQSDLEDAERLARAFDMVTRRVITGFEQDVELAKAMQDADSLVKNQIKLDVMNHARRIFEDCYRYVVGGSAWDD